MTTSAGHIHAFDLRSGDGRPVEVRCWDCDETWPIPAPPPLAEQPEFLAPGSPCPHCPDGHRDPSTRPWGVFVASERDSHGQPTHLYVAPPNGAHVAQSDAEWLWNLIREAS